VLWYKPMALLGVIWSQCRDESWSASLWQTFFSLAVGAQMPAISEMSPLWMQEFDALGNQFSTCTAHSGAKKAHEWAVEQFADLFRITHQVKTQQVARSRRKRCGDIELAGYLANAAGLCPWSSTCTSPCALGEWRVALGD
jgi:hypothetical protein